LKKLLGGTDLTTRVVQAVLTLAGVLGLLKTEWDKNPALLAISIGVLCGGAAWFGIGVYFRRRKPRAAIGLGEPRSVSTYLRGLLPFEKGDRLLGREQEVGQLLAMLRSLEFTVGFLSGEAGAGKTSLLRALIVPQLEADNRNPVYVPRAGDDPEAAIRKALLTSTTTPPTAGAQTSTLMQLVTAAMQGSSKRSMLIIIDQFEEFFIANRSREARAAFEHVLGQMVRAELSIGFLFALRKEFVDDLLDMAATIPALQNVRWRLPLRNLSSTTARQILRKIVEDEKLRFSEQLQEMVIADLARDKKVRPVEFQLVLTNLLSQEVLDVRGYLATQGAQGVLARFITEIIAPPEMRVGEVERWTARHVLRALCNDDFTSRRPVGLSRDELLDRLQTEVRGSAQLPAGKSEVELALARVLHRCVESYVMILEDEDRYNLTHDYLASPIRDATAGVETVEERATRLLERYIENSRIDRAVFPWKTLRFVRRFARPEALARSEAKALIRRSVVQQRIIVAGMTLGAITIATLILPFGVHYRIKDRLELSGDVRVSDSGGVLVTGAGKELTVHTLHGATFAPRVVSVGIVIKSHLVSPKGERVLLLAEDKSLHQVRTHGEAHPKKLFESTGWPNLAEKATGFSSDGAWTYTVLADGRVFVWPENNDPREIMQLRYLADAFERPRAVVNPVSEAVSEERPMLPRPPEAGMTHNGRHLWVLDGEGKLFVIEPTSALTGLPKELLRVKRKFMSNRYLAASRKGNRLAVSDGSAELRVVDLSGAAPSTPTVAIQFADTGRDAAKYFFAEEDMGRAAVMALSPSGRWLVARRPFNSFYAAKLDAPLRAAVQPAITLPPSSNDTGTSVVFDASETYAIGKAQDKKFYAWKLESPPGTMAKPVLESTRKPDSTATICPDGSHVLIGSEDGSIHSATLAPADRKSRSIGWLGAGAPSFYSLKDRATVVVHDGGRLAITNCNADLLTIHEQRSKIMDVVDDTRGNLVVVGEREVSRIGKSFYIFGIPVWNIPLPGVARQVGGL